MIPFEPAGVIFDVDDTLLDNQCSEPPYYGLHERSRLEAVRAVGKRHGIVALEQFGTEDNRDAFLTAPVHALDAAVWNILQMTGVEQGDVPDYSNPLLQEIVTLKNELHEEVLRTYGREVPDAVAFVQSLAFDGGLRGKMAIASTAVRRDVDLFFNMVGIEDLFPDKTRITRELITHPKPHPQAFDLAFGALGLPEGQRSRVCAFEDDPRGIMSAKAAGLYVCAITTRYSAASLAALEVPPDYIADTFAEYARYFNLPSLEQVACS